jgi:hypothetical protein
MALDSFNLVPMRTTTATETVTIDLDSTYWLDAQFTLVVRSAATAAADTLDVTIQQSHDKNDIDSSAWDEFVAFTQVVGNGGAVQVIGQWTRAVSPETEMRAPNTSLAAGNVVQGPIGQHLRAVATVVNNTDPSFDWKIVVSPMQTK